MRTKEPITAPDALQYAIRALSMRSLSEHELEKKLRNRQATAQIIAQTLERLRQYGFLNDPQIAARTAQDPNLGRFGVKRKLMARGINKHVIEDVLVTRDDSQDLEAAVALLTKYAARFTGDRAQHKATAFFMRRGFSFQIIRRAFDLHGLDAPNEEED